MKHLLPDDIQCLIWKIYFTNIVMLDKIFHTRQVRY